MAHPMHAPVFVTGATGYMGRALCVRLLQEGLEVRGLVRGGSEGRLVRGVVPVPGDALHAASYRDAIAPARTLVHLVGTPHPNPRKARQFRDVDLASIRAAAAAASAAGVRHVVYVSVAHPAPVMRAYVEARIDGERALRESGIPATVLRPWYVLGPGHRWPLALVPVYALLERLPGTRESARRLGLVTLHAMVDAMTDAVLHPAASWRVLDVPAIRAVARGAAQRVPLPPVST